MTQQYNDVRLVKGVPKPSDFGSKAGSPLVIDSDSGYAYYMKGADTLPLLPYPGKSVQAHAGMNGYPDQPFTLDATFHRIENYAQAATPTTIGFEYDLVEGSLTPLNVAGMLLSVSFNMTFTEVNAGRIFYARVMTIAGLIVAEIAVPVGRNTGGVLVGQTGLFHSAVAGRSYVIELGGGDVFDNCVMHDVQFNMVSMLSLALADTPAPLVNGFSTGFSLGFN